MIYHVVLNKEYKSFKIGKWKTKSIENRACGVSYSLGKGSKGEKIILVGVARFFLV